MKILQQMSVMDHERVVFHQDPESGLRAIIAVHNTTLGSALGGTRRWCYASEAEAILDVLRLSEGMTYKAAVAGLDLGGGKAVIIGGPGVKSEGLFRAFGRAVESLGGRYITAEDMNTTVDDMNMIARETSHVTGAGGAYGGAGDPSPITAWGVFHGLRACLEVRYGTPDLRGRKVAIQGVGNVGWNLAGYLHEAGAELFYADINTGNLDRAMSAFGGHVVDDDAFWSLDVDVLAPCAIGGVVNPDTLGQMKAPIIAGGANNVLLDEARDSKAVMDKGLIYAPDYVINAGGLMHVHAELKNFPIEQAMDDAAGIFDTVKKVLNIARDEKLTTIAASNALAERRIETVARVRRYRV